MPAPTHYAPFPVLSIEGDARACGEQHGAQAADRVAHTIRFYLGVFGQHSKLTLEQVRERARAYAGQIEAIDAGIMAEIRGIADGARQQLEDIVAINCRTELMYGASRGSRAAPRAGGSSQRSAAVRRARPTFRQRRTNRGPTRRSHAPPKLPRSQRHRASATAGARGDDRRVEHHGQCSVCSR